MSFRRLPHATGSFARRPGAVDRSYHQRRLGTVPGLAWFSFTCTLLLSGFWLCPNPAVGGDSQSVETVMKLPDLSPALQKAVQAKAAQGRLGEIVRTIEDGETNYSIEVTRNGRTRSFTLDDTGDLLDEEVFLSELPPRVQRAIHQHAGRSRIEEITKAIDEDEITYDVTITREGRERSFTLDATGQLLKTEVFLNELAAAVRAAITNAAGARGVGDINKTTDEGEVLWEVELSGPGPVCTLTFDDQGSLVSREEAVALTRTPVAVQQALAAQLAGGKLLGLTQTTEDGEVTYDAEVLTAGKRQTITLDAAGKPHAEP